jgi:hypothetical protein
MGEARTLRDRLGSAGALAFGVGFLLTVGGCAWGLGETGSGDTWWTPLLPALAGYGLTILGGVMLAVSSLRGFLAVTGGILIVLSISGLAGGFVMLALLAIAGWGPLALYIMGGSAMLGVLGFVLRFSGGQRAR